MKFQLDPTSDVPVRDAATVMVFRDGPTGVEVCMLRRNLKSEFVGGAYVFPGGAVDPGDSHRDLDPFVTGRSDVDASRDVDVEHGGLAFWVAAIRETFEEAGLLFARNHQGEFLSFDDPPVQQRFAKHRTDVDTGERMLLDICAEESLQLAVGEIHAFSRWITPVGAPRRYDTRFFVAAAPEFQHAIHDDHEVIATVWITPSEALERQRRGEFEMIFPTVRTLEALEPFESAAAIIDHASHISAIPAVLPRIVERDGGIRIVLPHDREFDAATAAPIAPDRPKGSR